MSYPPPTLVPRRSHAALARRIVVVVTLLLLVGTCAASRFLRHGGSKKTMATADVAGPLDTPSNAVTDVDAIGAPADEVSPNAAEAPRAQPAATVPANGPPLQPSADARQPNRWYYVSQIGDGPGTIYSRDGGGWDYALACTLTTRSLEFIATNVGDPGAFDKQYLKIGRVKLMMDASYSKEGHGTLSTALAAKHPFFDAFTGPGKMLEMELTQGRKIVLAIGPELSRVIRECRGPEAPPPADSGEAKR
jgi:hypothetical protein